MLMIIREKRRFHERSETPILDRSVSSGDYRWLETALGAGLWKHLERVMSSA